MAKIEKDGTRHIQGAEKTEPKEDPKGDPKVESVPAPQPPPESERGDTRPTEMGASVRPAAGKTREGR